MKIKSTKQRRKFVRDVLRYNDKHNNLMVNDISRRYEAAKGFEVDSYSSVFFLFLLSCFLFDMLTHSLVPLHYTVYQAN